MTIAEIASRAGVSKAAVSRYLNNGYVSSEKREAIRRVIEETGYVPSQQAQTLRTGKSRMVGVIVPRIDSESISRVVAGISKVLEAQGYRLLLANTDNNIQKELEYLEVFRSGNVDGVILVATILSAAILLGIMILPTIIGVSEAALRAVPNAYYEGAVAMGATHERAVFSVMLPAAKSGVLAGIVLGIGRAIGETMAVIMVAGNQPRLTASLLDGIRTMTANIVIEMGYASGLHREALIATGVVLFVFILLINLAFSVLKRRKDA